jgi:hypothetical protein
MRTGISFSLTPANLDRLRALVKDRNARQKHVWQAQIVLLSAEGLGTNAIMVRPANPRLASGAGTSGSPPKAWMGFCATKRGARALRSSILPSPNVSSR